MSGEGDENRLDGSEDDAVRVGAHGQQHDQRHDDELVDGVAADVRRDEDAEPEEGVAQVRDAADRRRDEAGHAHWRRPGKERR